jgi:hypothetical protein
MAISSQDAHTFRLKHAEELLALFEGVKTAKAVGLAIPPAFPLRADEVLAGRPSPCLDKQAVGVPLPTC